MIVNVNYNHLYYFWVVAEQGGITRAAEMLHLTPQTISAQITSLEQRVGRKLFEKKGRQLHLTDFGSVTKSYADEMFDKANEWLHTVVSGQQSVTSVCRVGVTDGLPKSLVSKWLSPILEMESHVQLECQDGKLEELLALMSAHKLDLILTDMPFSPEVHLTVDCQLLGKSSIGVFASEELVEQVKPDFPISLDGLEMVMPGQGTSLCQNLEQWFELHRVQPKVTVYANDIALMKTLGRDGFGVFAAPMIVKEEIIDKFHVSLAGKIDKVTQEYFLITPKRTIIHPVTAAIVKAADQLME